MIPHNNADFQAREQKAKMDPVPAGVYEGAIIGAKLETMPSGDQQLIIQVEITVGPLAGYYKRLYDSQAGSSFGAKYKGVLRQRIPHYDSHGKPASDADSFAHNSLQHMAWALEQSNAGYTWDWDESKLKGKQIGFSVREREWFMEDTSDERGYRTGITTEVFRLESLPAVQSGKVKTPKKRELGQRDKDRMAELDAQFGNAPSAAQAVSQSYDDELPFD